MQRCLSELLNAETAARSGLIEQRGGEDPLITGIEYDSRKVQPGSLYFALPGLHTDGHRYIGDAVQRGAVAVVHEAELPEQKPGVVYLAVKSSRFAMSPIAAAFYGFPSRKLITAGVTGTEGKSTTVSLIWQLLRLLGKKAGFVSTVQYSTGGQAQWNPEHQTTPEAPLVQRLLWQMAENGCEYAVVESSSHGLSPRTNRLGDVEFDAAVLTNVAHEHLEFHGTWEQYRDDKANLFRALDRERPKAPGSIEPFGVVNADDKSALYFAEATARHTMSFSTKGKDANLSLRAIESGAAGNWYDVYVKTDQRSIDIRDQLPGAFNTGNMLAALLAVSGMTGLPVSAIAPLCRHLLPVKGRMTTITKGQPFEVIVDYAHTPSSFLTVFPPLRKRLDKTGGRIICLFGSAGERDTQKRAEQGSIAAVYADIIVLTDEDPRGEDPLVILEAIAAGCLAPHDAVQYNAVRANPVPFKRDKTLFLIPNRPVAIRKALSLARSGDAVLLLGKGHENTIIYHNRVIPFDEIAEAEQALGELFP